MRWVTSAPVVLLLSCVGGCYTITLQTRIADDGAVERTVQVNGRNAAHDFVVPPEDEWKEHSHWLKGGYYVSGRFKSPAAMPTGYALRVKGSKGDTAPSRIEWRREDRIFYTLYEFRETIPDVVTAASFDEASDEAVDLVIDFVCGVLRDAISDADPQPLIAYVRRDRRRALKSLAWAVYENRQASVEADDPSFFPLWRHMLAILAEVKGVHPIAKEVLGARTDEALVALR